MLEPYCEKYGLPAIGAAVIKDGRTIAMGTAGTRKTGQKIPVNTGDRFHIGSNTKAITSLLAAMFVKGGKAPLGFAAGRGISRTGVKQ